MMKNLRFICIVCLSENKRKTEKGLHMMCPVLGQHDESAWEPRCGSARCKGLRSLHHALTRYDGHRSLTRSNAAAARYINTKLVLNAIMCHRPVCKASRSNEVGQRTQSDLSCLMIFKNIIMWVCWNILAVQLLCLTHMVRCTQPNKPQWFDLQEAYL